ncbi:MAG: hypothetical protein HOW73_36255 [Polyangiaceae bacterium]|nr:hypothetical protein [Polyangiaceae bacterium]
MSSSDSSKDVEANARDASVVGQTSVDIGGVLGRIQRATRIVQFRMRLARVLGITPLVVPIGILLVAASLAVHKVYPTFLPEVAAYRVFFGIAAVAATSLLVAFFLPLSPNAGAVALDKHHGLDGRLTNAIEFASVPAGQRTALMQAAIDEACTYVAARPSKRTLGAAVAAPLFAAAIVSWWLFPLLLVPSVGMLGLVSVFEIRTVRPEPEKVTPPVQANTLDLNKDDLKALREEADELKRPDQPPEMKSAIDKFNKLIEDLAAKRLERSEAFRQMEALERELVTDWKKDRDKIAQELNETSKALDKSELAKNLAQALKENDLKKAEEEMRKLAERVTDKKKPVDKAQLQKLRDALKKAVENRKKALEEINKRREEMKEELLKKKKQIEEEKDPKKKEEEEKLLKKKERELERLDRESQAQASANRELERLDRELADAAAQLMKELGITPEDIQKASEKLKQAAEDLKRMEREAQSEKEKEELKKKLEELRELIRQEGPSSKTRKRMRESFARKANGKSKGRKGRKSSGSGEEPDDEGEEGEEQGDQQGNGNQGEEGEGEEGEGEDGPEGPKGKGKRKGKGSGEGEGEGEGLELQIGLGPGGAPIPGMGGAGNQPGEGAGKGGKDWGTGSGGPVAGESTDPNMETHNVEQMGQETNSGSSASKTIRSAAERGFRGAEYEEWFKKYRTVAEEDMKQEDIPDGYRFYVRQYFRLIGPRDE